MAQSGYTPIQLYHSTTAGNAPTAADLLPGELAINIADGIIYYEDDLGVVQQFTSGGGGGGGGGTSVTVTQVTATASQTDFSVTYTVGQLSVYLNGALLASADYTATNGTTVVLAAGAAANDIFTAVAYDSATQITQGDSSVVVTDTGSDGTITFDTDGSERMRITSAGNVGIGVTPSSWSGISGKVFEFGYSGGNAALFQNGVNDTHFTSNAYYNGSAWTYNKTGTATRFYQGSGTFQMHGASSGTAGNAITFTQIFGLSKGNTLFLEGATSQSGTGITFPATQSASSNANTLDDYEEGTWTPVLTFATPGTVSVGYQAREGFYTKIGRFVHFSCFIQLNAFTKGTASGNLRVSGLPFTAQNPGNNELPISWAVYDTPLPTSAGQFPTPILEDNDTVISLIYASNNAVNTTWPDPDSSSQYKLSGCYQV